MHSRCCWPPESPAPGSLRRSATSSHRPALCSAASTLPCRSPLRRELSRSPDATLSKMDIVGNGLGFWKTMPDRPAYRYDVHRWGVHVEVVEHHPSLGPGSGDLLVHAVDAAHHRRLAAARRPDDRRHLAGAELEVDALDLFGVAVEGAQLLQPDAQPRSGLDARIAGGRGRVGWARDSLHGRLRARLRSVLLAPLELRGVHVSPLSDRPVGCHARRLLREIRRAMRLSSRIMVTSVSAAPHARCSTEVRCRDVRRCRFAQAASS